jgi:hypothetical protein
MRSPTTMVGSWLLVSACGGNPDACSMLWAALALFFTSLRTIPLMPVLAKDTPASMVFRGDVLVWLWTSYFISPFSSNCQLGQAWGECAGFYRLAGYHGSLNALFHI